MISWELYTTLYILAIILESFRTGNPILNQPGLNGMIEGFTAQLTRKNQPTRNSGYLGYEMIKKGSTGAKVSVHELQDVFLGKIIPVSVHAQDPIVG